MTLQGLIPESEQNIKIRLMSQLRHTSFYSSLLFLPPSFLAFRYFSFPFFSGLDLKPHHRKARLTLPPCVSWMQELSPTAVPLAGAEGLSARGRALDRAGGGLHRAGQGTPPAGSSVSSRSAWLACRKPCTLLAGFPQRGHLDVFLDNEPLQITSFSSVHGTGLCLPYPT